ncbi:hypothetical protein [Sediminibacter sp. Hel_I_10]|uniref:hypothetical protein n=1 Tax=Sediminibacter sp. Hel_I_10 TaxID=1392490 RepID=UPI00047E9B8D|nr:hypothetical protein [Sediminibacter sp. Hel_I_10]
MNKKITQLAKQLESLQSIYHKNQGIGNIETQRNLKEAFYGLQIKLQSMKRLSYTNSQLVKRSIINLHKEAAIFGMYVMV